MSNWYEAWWIWVIVGVALLGIIVGVVCLVVHRKKPAAVASGEQEERLVGDGDDYDRIDHEDSPDSRG